MGQDFDVDEDIEETVKFSEEESNRENRFRELETKKDRTEEENVELDKIKKERSGRFYQKIKESKIEAAEAKREAREAQQRLEEMQQRLAELEKKKSLSRSIDDLPMVTYGNKDFYTNESLRRLVKDGRMTDEEAWDYKDERDNFRNEINAANRLKQEFKQEEDSKIRMADINKVFTEHPELNEKSVKFNPNSPLYKKVADIYQKGYKYSPTGLSESLNLAKELLGSNNNTDLSDELSLPSSNSYNDTKKDNNINLSEEEKSLAIRMYCRGDVKNPKTGRVYTENEAISTALQAKKERKQYLANRRGV